MQHRDSTFENIKLEKLCFLIKKKIYPQTSKKKNNPIPKQVMNLFEEGKNSYEQSCCL